MIERIIYIVALIILALAQSIQFLIMKRDGKKRGNPIDIDAEELKKILENRNDKPGKAAICIQHIQSLTNLSGLIEHVRQDVKENKENIKEIFKMMRDEKR